MSKKKRKGGKDAGFKFMDFFMIVLCLSGAVVFFNKFRLDFFQTIYSRNEEPAGLITLKHNTVQRRPHDRVYWDWLRNESPVYLGDLIRVADLSDATLHIAGNYIHLNENTSIRIRRAPDNESPFQVDLDSGSLSLSTGTEGGSITLNLMGRQVDAGPGTTLSASATADGIAVQVSEGDALFINKGQKQALVATAMVALDSGGRERVEPAVVVRFPPPDAHYLKSGPEPLNIGFAWDRHYLQPGEALRMEIAEDRNFSRIVRAIERLDSTAETALGAGQWYWRLSYKGAVLGAGKITVANAAGPELLSPASGKLFRFEPDSPLIRFQWSKVAEASSYILEASQTDDFTNPRIRRQVGADYVIESNMEEGIWYWRVTPVFPSTYSGSAIPSSVSSVRIERGEPLQEPLWPEPKMVNAEVPAESSAVAAVTAAIEPSLPDTPPAVPAAVRLIAPAQGTSLPGLTALRQQTVFQWDSDGEAQRLRFVLSRNSNPLKGKPLVEKLNPGKTIRLDRLEEGVWYWTVEARFAGGLIKAAEPRQLRVLPIPLLNEPKNRLPPDGYRVTIDEIKKISAINFRWSAVPNANAYIFTLYRQAAKKRQIIDQRTLDNRTGWTFDLGSLDGQGAYIWQVEAVNKGQGGKIEQRGKAGENSFFMDIPRPGPVKIEDPGVLYGN
jgi:hypothetical protein